MKKFLSVLLAVMMVFSAVATMIVSVSAVAAVADDATETPNSIIVSDGTDAATNFYDPTTPGWSMTNNGNGDNTYKVVDIVTGKETEKAVGDVITGPATFPIFGYRFHYWAAETLDISGMKYVEFDLYLTDATAYQGETMIVELSSKGIDEEEISFEAKYPLVDGWNHVRLSIADNFTGKNGEINKTAWKFMRVHFSNQEATATVAEGEEFIIAIDNLEFNNGLTNGGAEVAPHKVTLSDCDAKVDGWNWVGNGNLKATDDADNTGSVSHTLLPGSKIKGAGAIIGLYDMDGIGGDTPDHLDVTGASKYIFEFYASEVTALADLKWVIELTSGGNCDVEEISWGDVTLGQFVEGGLKEGWNTIVLDLTDKSGGGYRPEHWNFFRMYSNESNSVGFPNGLTLAIDNARFVWDDGTVLTVSDCNPDTKGWGASVAPMGIAKVTGVDEETGEDVQTIQNVMGVTYTSDVAAGGGLQILYKNSNNTAVNITGMKYLTFDFYVSDAAALPESRNIFFELTSGGSPDQQEISYQLYTSDNESLGIKEGWNHIIIPLSLFTDKTGGEMQWTYVNCFRMYNQNPITVNGELTIAIDNVVFWDGLQTLGTSGRGDILQARETITFMPNTEAEKAYQYGEWKKENKGDQHRFSNTDGIGIYKFTVENAATAKGAVFTAKIGGQLKLSVSTDGENWTVVYNFEDPRAAAGKPNNLEKAVRAFDLTEYIVDDEGILLGDTIYVKFQDSYGNVAGGWGAQIHYDAPVTLDVTYDIPEFEDTDNYTFTVGTASEEAYLVEAGSINAEKSVRFADQNNKIVYKYDLTRTENLESAAWSVGIQGQYVVSASTDGQNWVEVLRWDGTEGGDNGPTTAVPKLIDLKGLNLTGTVEAIYIMITDADTSNGHGGAVTNTQPTTLSVKYFDAASMKHDKTSFTATVDDEAYLFENNDAGVAGGPSRYADQHRSWTYKYDVKGIDGIKTITWTATISAQYHVWASADGETWVEIGKSEAVANKAVVDFDASALIADVTKSKTIYIKVGDAVVADGNGGRVWADAPVVLDIAYIPLTDAQKDLLEMAGDAHSVSLEGCNALWSATEYELDFDNATAGSACLSVDLKNGIISQKKFDNPVNAKGMDTLEFELYLSDLAILDDITFGGGDALEITSGGKADVGEKNYDLSKIMSNLKASGTAVVGWNHISLPLADFGDTDTSGNTPFDIEAINFIRIFWVAATMPADSDKYTIKFDNFRLTDAQKVAEDKLAADKAAFNANHADLVAELKALNDYSSSSSITEENYEAVKAQIAAVKAKVEALTEAEQQIAKDAGYIKYMEKAESSVGKYEDKLDDIAEALETNKALVDAINALVTEITADNYETVKAAVEAARTQYDALARSVKNIFTDKGLTEKLEAAEAAVEAFKTDDKTECEHADADGDNKCDKCGADMGTTTKPGCFGVLSMGAVATMVLAGAWVTMAARKRED